MTVSILDEIASRTRADLAERIRRIPLPALRDQLASAPPPRSLSRALTPERGGPARVIGEIKRASPSKGLLAEHFDPVARAEDYVKGGCSAISVLTEPHYFQGALEHLTAVRAAAGIPVLRKDFIVDAYQVYEARAAGADAVLLFCALLDDAALRGLLALTEDLGMDALVEAHTDTEIERAVAAGARVIGVNARDLRTFSVDTGQALKLRRFVPPDRLFVAESGIASAQDATRARAWGADALLVGEALMRSGSVTATAQRISHAGGGATASLFHSGRYPFVKICGLTQPEHAAAANDADAIGLVFAQSHRRVTVEQALAVRTGLPLSGRDSVLVIGVFVNERPASVAEFARAAALDAVQLSGDESIETCSATAGMTGLPVIKALRPTDDADIALADSYASAGMTLLLDAAVPGHYGGSGQTSNWGIAAQIAQRWPVILSGGLRPVTVASALARVAPRGLDVSSGVEHDRVKDPELIRAFLRAARTAEVNTVIEGR